MVAEFIGYFLIALAGVFVIVNPLTTAFIFSSLLSNASDNKRRIIAKRAVVVSSIVLIIFALVGGLIFKVFNISLEAFRIAGGIILFGIAINMLRDEKKEEGEINGGRISEGIAIVPLAIPFISGPGAITTVMILTNGAPGVYYVGLVFLAILATTITCFYTMVYSKHITRFLGDTGRQVVSKIFGLILAVISVQFVLNGIYDVAKNITFG